jgi:hypothetical protein
VTFLIKIKKVDKSIETLKKGHCFDYYNHRKKLIFNLCSYDNLPMDGKT